MSYLQALPGELRRKIHCYVALNEWRDAGSFALEGAVEVPVDKKLLLHFVDPSGDTLLARYGYGGSHTEVICVHSMSGKAAGEVRMRIPGRVEYVYSQPGLGPFLVAQSLDFSSIAVYNTTGDVFAQRSLPVAAPGARVHCEWQDTDSPPSQHWVRAGRTFYRMPALSMSLPAPPTLQQRGLSRWAIFGSDGNECLAVVVWTAEEDEQEARGLEDGVCRLQVWELHSGRHLHTLEPSFAIDEADWLFLPGQHAALFRHSAAFYTSLYSLTDGRVLFRVESINGEVEDSLSSSLWLLTHPDGSAALSCYDLSVGAWISRTLPENNGSYAYYDNSRLLGIRSPAKGERYTFLDLHTQSSLTVPQPAAVLDACLHAGALFYVVQPSDLLIEVWMMHLAPVRQPRLVLWRPLPRRLYTFQIRFMKPIGSSYHPPMLCLHAELWSIPLRSLV
jgi:hypothetical protein